MFWPHVVLGRRIAAVKRVLLTGMSGTGKSSVIHALSARGFLPLAARGTKGPPRPPPAPAPPASLPNAEPPIGAVSGRFAASAADAREGTFCALVRRICRPVKLIVGGSAPCRPDHGSQLRGYRTMCSATRRVPPL